ncbi:MAG TPA: YciI family protein [Dehalococcoidia bacterium]|nr:YciI family protein [Dehalococcoidia bacterium]
MRFMSLVKGAENQGTPPQALMEAMGELIEKSMKAGVLIDTGGLAPSAMSTRVRLSGGRYTVVDGPFAETKELVGGYAIMELNSREEAIEAAKEFLDLHTAHWPEWVGECEVRQIFSPND